MERLRQMVLDGYDRVISETYLANFEEPLAGGVPRIYLL
jgi:hypothetical protein